MEMNGNVNTMQRTIKFRARDTKNKVFFYLTDSDIVIGNAGRYTNGKYMAELKLRFFNQWLTEIKEHVSGKDVIIMEYTGLTDSSGKEIYEDDIIHIGGWRYPRQIVKFRDGGYKGVNKYVGEGFFISELLKTNVVTVIGNIHDNPELISESL